MRKGNLGFVAVARKNDGNGVQLLSVCFLRGVTCVGPHWVPNVCNADALDHFRVSQDGWRASEVVEEPNSGTEKDRCDVDLDFVE